MDREAAARLKRRGGASGPLVFLAMTALREPRPSVAGPAELFSDYLDWYRETAIAKVAAVSAEEQRTSRLPTGWTPL